MRELINRIRRETESFSLSPQTITELINRIQDLQSESSPIVQIICDDDFQVLKLARLLIIKLSNFQSTRNHIQITEEDWRDEEIEFSLIRFWIDDLEINRIIAHKFIALGGNVGFDVVRQRDSLRFIYDEIENVLNNLRLEEETSQEQEAIREDISNQIQYRRETEIQQTLSAFKQFVERDGWKAFWGDGSVRSNNTKNCPEEIGKGQFMAFLKGYGVSFQIHHNTFQEIQEGAGFCDVIHIDHSGNRYVFELKIWRGPRYFQTGITKLDSYLSHENLNEGYCLLFDTRIRKQTITTPITTENGKIIHVIQIDIAQIVPTSQD